MAFNSSVIANIHTPVSDPPRSPSVNSRVAESSVSRSSPVGGPNKQTEAGPSKHKDTDADVTLKWFKKYNTRKLAYNHGHPYVCRSITFGSPYDKEAQRFEDVKFWPFVGPLEPPGLLAGVQSWEYCKNMVAIATKNKLVVARCEAENPWQPMTSVFVIDDHLYTVAWTYDPITLRPLLITGGFKSLLYVIDVIDGHIIRTLRGHGGAILCIAINMLHPHIIASSSYDKTTRIWNLRGADAPTPPPGRMPDENYPMADADEGTCVVAVLAGEGGGGHRFYVTYIAFHPTKNAIASCGADRAVKIWTFGTLPEPDLTPAPTPQGYRPTIITSPVMTTTRLFDDFTDYIEWLNEDTLITRGRRQLAIWQWIGYKRYFGPGSSTTRIPDLSPFGLVDCGSVTVLSRYNIGSDLWSITPGFHRGFKPSTPTEKAMSLENPDIVTDPLIALAVHPVGKSHTYPEISLINPLLADETAGPRPKPPRELRARRVSDTSDRPAPATSSKVAPDNEEMTDSQAVDNVTVIDLAESDSEEDDESEGDRKDNRNPTMEPWRVVASPWPEVIKTYSKSKMSPQHLKPRSDPTNICNIAISPRGAEFIVGVGEHETVFVWSLVRPSTKDAAKTKEPDTPKEKAGAEDADTSIGAGAGASTSAGTGSDAGAADSIAVSIVV